MNKVLARLSLVLLILAALAPAVRADVLLSELCDPRLNYLTDRYIEIYNSGPDVVDLTGWQIVAVGNSVDIYTWNLSGTIAPGQALVAGDDAPVIAFPIDFVGAGWSANTTNWNGKIGDGARLMNGAVVVDDVVVPGTNFENSTMVRNADITSPSLAFNAAEWTATPVDLPTDATPGVHNPVASLGPVLGTITTVPAAPLPGQTVDVQAVVTDVATITGVTLNWGTTSGALINAIAMSPIGGDVFATATAIPGQAAGATVFYAVTADNDVPAQTVSGELSYTLPSAATIAAIQGAGTVSPLVGQVVATSGVVTAAFGTTFVIQDGSGARSGLWVSGPAAPAVGSQVDVLGTVAEINSNTTLATAQVIGTAAGSLPLPEVLATGTAGSEDWEGVLVQVVGADCTASDSDQLYWTVSNSGGPLAVDDLAIAPALVLGTTYTISGPISGSTSAPGIVPRDAGDIVFVADNAAPVVEAVVPLGPTSIRVSFSEGVDAVTAGNAANYSLLSGTVSAATPVVGQPAVVELTVSFLANGNNALTVDGVSDLFGNTLMSAIVPFSYYGGNIPVGYYNAAEGLVGTPLQVALHGIIDGHTSISYTGLWSAYYTTDVKPNGKVWDMYSDVPGGTPPYEYTLGVDQGGSAGTEGTGYNREHCWPSSWYGAISPMYSDVFLVYPTDNEVNNRRGNYPYGEVAAPTWTSLNGSRVGPCVSPGYTGVVFEPIDEYKGDFARSYFYMATRYYGEDAGWPGSDMTSGATLLPWAEDLLLAWHAADPVSTKEIDRNEAAYAIQHNRNPFIDRPDFVLKMFHPELSPVVQPSFPGALVLNQNVPNPFNPSTTISYELAGAGPVSLQVFDLSGRLVTTVFEGGEEAGRHEKIWLGRDQTDRPVATGVYFYRLRAGGDVETRRMMLVK